MPRWLSGFDGSSAERARSSANCTWRSNSAWTSVSESWNAKTLPVAASLPSGVNENVRVALYMWSLVSPFVV